MEQRLHVLEQNVDILNTTVAVLEDRYGRLDPMITEVRSDVKTLLERTARLEGPQGSGGGGAKKFLGGLAAAVIGAAGLLIDRR